MKKKLNHEAFQAYYNTSSSNHCGMNMMNIQSSPVAGGGQSSGMGNGPPSGGAKAQNSAAALNLNTANVYGQNLLYANNQASGSSSSSSTNSVPSGPSSSRAICVSAAYAGPMCRLEVPYLH